jgi:hypothetical protein
MPFVNIILSFNDNIFSNVCVITILYYAAWYCFKFKILKFSILII